MKVSVQVDYACRVMAELARLHGSGALAQIDHLSKVESVPATFLAQLLCKLRNAGLIQSRRGNHGGYTLARAPEEISLFDILTAIEGHCLQLSGNFEGRSGRRLKQVWDDLSKELSKRTQGLTLDQFAGKKAEEMYYI